MPLTRRAWVLALLAPAVARAQVAAPPPEVQRALPQAQLQGEGRLRFLGLRIYDARLWVAPGLEALAFARVPLALELIYARSLKGRLIAERSLTEMARGGPIDAAQRSAWLAAMVGLFPDVNEGDRLTGVFSPGLGAAFHVNGTALGEVRDAAFAERFLGIWLSPLTSEPALRQALLNGGRITP
ncbi:MAG: hypothetical protein RJA98_573 [Pseudomonadota bacterium]|jgi:hypothetical protein